MRPPEQKKVEEIMTAGVVEIDNSESLKTAMDRMEQHGLHKLLLADQGQPKGILEDWFVAKLASKLPPNTSIGDALNRFSVEAAPVKPVDPGTSVDEIKPFLGSFAAVVVRGKDPKKAAGIVTATDLEKLL